MSAKVFVIGLDAATFDIITPLMQAGRLPAFQSLCHSGASGQLASTIHPLSPPAWTSFITGKNPGKHGIYDFVVHKPNSYELEYTHGGMRTGQSIWSLLSNSGKKVVVLNVPMTYPPETVNGILISGFDSPGMTSNFAYPPEILEEITGRIGEYRLRDYPQGHNPESFLEHIMQLFDFRKKLVRYMMGRFEWDFFMMVFGELDLVQHAYWQYTDPAFRAISDADRRRFGGVIEDMYIQMDRELGALLQKLSEDVTVVVMSDHGAGPCYKAVFINKWLEEKGFFAYLPHGKKTWGLELIKQLHATLKKALPVPALEWLKNKFPHLRQRVKSKIVFSEIDWAKTQAWSFGRESTNLFINLKGKFPNGIVAPGEEYEKLRSRLIDELSDIKDPVSDRPVVEKAYRGEDVYHGECMQNAPDLLVIWKDYQYTAWPGYHDRNRELFEPSLNHSDYADWSQLQKGGNHRPNGILLIKGPAIKQGFALENARIVDLAPTILWLLQTEIPSDMDGRLLEEIVDSSYLANNPPRFKETATDEDSHGTVQSYSEAEALKVQERLRGLGYIE